MRKQDPKTGLWFVQISGRHPLTRQPKNLRRKNIENETLAKKIEKELERKLMSSFEDLVTPTWGKLIEEYVKYKSLSDWNAKTTEDFLLTINAHTMDAWRSRRIEYITPQEIKNLLVEKVGERSPGTQQNFLKYVRGAFSYAVDMRYLSSNPAPTMRFKIGEKVKAYLKEDEVKLLLQKAKEFNHPWRYHWALAIYTGLRNGELFALDWDHVDMKNGIISVKYSWNKKAGLKSTKSNDDRVVDIAPRLLELLKELRAENPESHFVLPRSRDWDMGRQAEILRTFLMGMGLRPIKFHDLRATFATLLLIKGIEPIKVMVLGGWKNMKTMQIYLRTAGVEVKGVTKVLDL